MSELGVIATGFVYGDCWYRLELKDGRVVYVGACGCCSSPWLESDEPEGVEWRPDEPHSPDERHGPPT